MGKIEKLIVLAVLFAAAIVLAVSLTRGKGEAQAADPLDGARDLLDGGADLGAGTRLDQAFETGRDTAPAESAPSLLLHAGSEVEPAPAPAPLAGLTPALQLEPASDPSRPILLDQSGLRPSFMDEYMLYTVVEGDTWTSLAQRFYQDGGFTRNLHLANEDLSELTPGKSILVPVYDLLATETPGVASTPVTTTETPAAKPPEPAPSFLTPPGAQPAPALARDAAPTRGTAALVYEVRAGDTLSEISHSALGTATRWKEILELNQDVLKRAEDLRVGMKLKLPAGAKAPTAKPEAKKPAEQPKTAKSEPAATGTSTKKKKVL